MEALIINPLEMGGKIGFGKLVTLEYFYNKDDEFPIFTYYSFIRLSTNDLVVVQPFIEVSSSGTSRFVGDSAAIQIENRNYYISESDGVYLLYAEMKKIESHFRLTLTDPDDLTNLVIAFVDTAIKEGGNKRNVRGWFVNYVLRFLCEEDRFIFYSLLESILGEG